MRTIFILFIMTKLSFAGMNFTALGHLDAAMIIPPDFRSSQEAIIYGSMYRNDRERIEGLQFERQRYEKLAVILMTRYDNRTESDKIKIDHLEKSLEYAYKVQLIDEALEGVDGVGADVLIGEIPLKKENKNGN